MATHRPLVVVDGTVRQLPVGDTVAGAAGFKGSGTATLDFGAAPGSNEATVAVTGLTGITSAAGIAAWVSTEDSTASHTQNDHRYFATLCAFTPGAITPDTGFDIHATSIHKLTGQFKVRYSWST